jgi:hypothetical protein
MTWMGSSNPGSVSSAWNGTAFKECLFPHGVKQLHSEARGRSDVRLGLSHCTVLDHCELARKSRISDTTVDGYLELGSMSRARNVTAKGTVMLSSGVDCEDLYVSVDRLGQEPMLAISGSNVRVTFNERAPQGIVRVTESATENTKIHMEYGGVVVLEDSRNQEPPEITGDIGLTAVVDDSASNLRSSVPFAHAKREFALSMDREDPAWVATNNDEAWGYLEDLGEISYDNQDIDSIPRDTLLLAVTLYPNPLGYRPKQ